MDSDNNPTTSAIKQKIYVEKSKVIRVPVKLANQFLAISKQYRQNEKEMIKIKNSV